MSAPATYHFRRPANEPAPPEVWRMLDHTVARWVRAHGGSAALAELAGWASLADGHGDSALPLRGEAAGRHGMPPLEDDALEQVMADPMVTVVTAGSTQAAPAVAATPFVVDSGYFYLLRNHLHEGVVARHANARRAGAGTEPEGHPADIEVLFHGDGSGRVAAQRAAVAQVPGKRLFVLTGGPGTGKTTTVLRMLMLLLKRRAGSGAAPAVVRIGAPTGKAAQRLSESLRDGARLMRDGPTPLPEDWHPWLDASLNAPASTLHRLLGSRGHGGGFVHHAGNPVPADIVIVDEASMVDLAMLRHLLEALREDAALILVGDADQLTSVGTGSVLLDLVGAMEAAADPGLVRLSHSFRADQSLLPLNEAVRLGDIDAFERAVADAGDQVRRVQIGAPHELDAALASWARSLADGLRAAGAFSPLPRGADGAPDQSAVLTALDGLRERQLLCALREGEFGAEAANRHLESSVRAASSGDALSLTRGEWYPGRAVMITRNDYTAGLFNGDLGICLEDADGALGVWFAVTVAASAASAASAGSVIDDDAGAPATERSRRAVCFAPGSLPDHQGGFAITIHKSQGSEYREVAVLLPPDPDNRILSRQLLYTGISRARQKVQLWQSDAVLRRAISTPARRSSGLRARLDASQWS
ncbi:AAA family ATPase [Novilysobacter avium]|uniref:RecBCD enzyme subunit RecD n=1 Tax=Novilysobacter avium TaxID=2781023 RepID=A0A7S6UMN0_9GAMM|nr:AAA family ATPase [Lysobacter avium]QOW23061.1 AAA family ATPase [Lysobacter avium]